MEQCLFCDTYQGRVPIVGGLIYEDELVYAYHLFSGENVQYLGHLLLATKRHIPGFADLTEPEAQRVGLLIARLSQVLKICTSAEKVYVTSYSEVTPHLHIHLTARYPGTPAEYLRWKIEDWPAAPQGNKEEIAALSQQSRSALVDNHLRVESDRE